MTCLYRSRGNCAKIHALLRVALELKSHNEVVDVFTQIKGFVECCANRAHTGDGERRTYHGYSMLITFSLVGRQSMHVDLWGENCQYVVPITQDSDGTLCWSLDEEHEIDSPEKFLELFSEGKEKPPKGVSGAIVKRVKGGNSRIRKCFADYGNILSMFRPQMSDEDRRKAERSMNRLEAGSLIAIPAKVVHAGPATSEDGKVRAALFFSSHFTYDHRKKYSYEYQQNGVSVMFEIIVASWKRMNSWSRVWMLNRLVEIICKDVYRSHCLHVKPSGSQLCAFVGEVEKMALKIEKEEGGVMESNELINKLQSCALVKQLIESLSQSKGACIGKDDVEDGDQKQKKNPRSGQKRKPTTNAKEDEASANYAGDRSTGRKKPRSVYHPSSNI